jgi:hypothetical protein
VSGYNLADNQDREDRRKHLELVSKVVDRMAGASAAAKGWSITVAGAAFGVAVVRGSWFVFLLGVVGLVVFGIMDGLYLHNEKRFRDLYAAIVANEVEPLSMDITKLSALRKRRDSHRSWSVFGFYGPLAAVGLVLMVVSISRVDAKQNQSPSRVPTAPAQISTTTSHTPLPTATTATPTPTTASSTPATITSQLPAPPAGPPTS